MIAVWNLPTVPLTVYEPSVQADICLFEWWRELMDADDMESAFGSRGFLLTEFCQIMRSTQAYYTADETNRWDRVAWSRPVMGGADFGCWLRHDRRQSKESLGFVVAVLRELFSRVPVLTSLTTEDRVVGDLHALGFQELGGIPRLFDGKTVYVLYLERSTFNERVTPC